jgi:hypothetical protein
MAMKWFKLIFEKWFLIALTSTLIFSGMVYADKYDGTSDRVGQFNKVQTEVLSETAFIKTHLPITLQDPASLIYGTPNTTTAEALDNYYYKFGDNESIGITEETVWDGGGIYTYPASASVMLVSSDSGGDTQTGFGARSVKLSGVDDTYTFIEESVLTYGTAATLTTNQYLRVFRVVVTSAGTSETADGDIYVGTGAITAGVPANIFAQIAQGNNQTQMSIFTIPDGKLGMLVTWGTDTGEGKAVHARLIARPFGEVFQQKDEMRIFESSVVRPVPAPPIARFQPKTDIEVRASSGAPGTDVHSYFYIYLVDLP